MDLDDVQHEQLRTAGINVIEEPVTELQLKRNRIAALRTYSGIEHRFDTLYSALGVSIRTKLALDLGAGHDNAGCLTVDRHQQTTIPGLYAAGDITTDLNQICVATSQAAIAATAIHNSLRNL